WDTSENRHIIEMCSFQSPANQVEYQPWGAALAQLIAKLGDKLGFVFPALHGGAGEDGTIQAILESCGVPYAGSGPLSSGLAMNKRLSKILFEAHELPTPPWRSWNPDPSPGPGEVASLVDSLGGWPIVLKPEDQGSSVGVSIVKGPEEMDDAIHSVRSVLTGSDRILAEKFIEGRELTVGILGNQSLPPVEIEPTGSFYDYKRKYSPGASKYIVPAPLEEEVSRGLKRLGLWAFQSLGCRGFGRVDFRLDRENRPNILEVNTIPGMTELSLLPMAAKAGGIDFNALIAEICRLGCEVRQS
ncbi:MAG: D-alanine--D-alanine ligase, partial [Candidatus Eisenbacteria bacterium]|nr:D-alanine--D-alanine ligase [Candidatus Eisenbacteria bacterium]